MEPKGIIFTPRREQALKQSPFRDKTRQAESNAKRHPQTRRYMFMRADHRERNLLDGPVNPDRMKTEDWEGVTHFVKQTALTMGADLVGVAPVDEYSEKDGGRRTMTSKKRDAGAIRW